MKKKMLIICLLFMICGCKKEEKEIIVKAMGDSLIHVKSELEGIIRSYNLEYNKKLF